jgi:hypothetical protein
LNTGEEPKNVDSLNLMVESYFESFGVSTIDNIKYLDELALLFIVATINSNIGKNDKMVFFFSYLSKFHEETQTPIDEGLVQVLFRITKQLYSKSDFKTTADIGEIAWKANLLLDREKKESSLEILNILYTSYGEIGDAEKALYYLEQEVSIGKKVLGERDSRFLTSLYNFL